MSKWSLAQKWSGDIGEQGEQILGGHIHVWNILESCWTLGRSHHDSVSSKKQRKRKSGLRDDQVTRGERRAKWIIETSCRAIDEVFGWAHGLKVTGQKSPRSIVCKHDRPQIGCLHLQSARRWNEILWMLCYIINDEIFYNENTYNIYRENKNDH